MPHVCCPSCPLAFLLTTACPSMPHACRRFRTPNQPTHLPAPCPPAVCTQADTHHVPHPPGAAGPTSPRGDRQRPGWQRQGWRDDYQGRGAGGGAGGQGGLCRLLSVSSALECCADPHDGRRGCELTHTCHMLLPPACSPPTPHHPPMHATRVYTHADPPPPHTHTIHNPGPGALPSGSRL